MLNVYEEWILSRNVVEARNIRDDVIKGDGIVEDKNRDDF